MKITLKTLQGKQLPMEVEPDMTVDAFKDKIAQEHDMPAAQQNLVAYGKVLAEGEKPIGFYGLKDGDFVVIMIKKAKAPPKEKAVQPVPVPVPAPTQVEVPAEVQPQPDKEGDWVDVNDKPTVVPSIPQPAPTGIAVNEEQVNTLVAISGKDIELCKAALQAAQGDPDRAFSFLIDGIPQQMMPGLQPQPNQPYNPNQEEFEGSYGEEGEGEEMDEEAMMLMELIQDPNFQVLRERLIADPSFYGELMTSLQQSRPEIFNAIQANPQLFMQLLAGVGQEGGMEMEGEEGEGEADQVIELTDAELEAVQRLEQLGFTREQCVQAYISCDKNEELAASFLFDSMGM